MPKRPHQKRGQQKEPKKFEEEVVQIDRVTRVVKGGRKLRFRATVVIGNKKGKVGIGIGKSHEVTGAIQKAIAKAKKNLFKIHMDGTTIPHQTKKKFKSAIVLLLPAAPGTGIIAGGAVRKVVELAGIKDILSKRYGTTNKLNNVKATFEALREMRVTPMMEKRAEKARSAAAKAKEKAQSPKPKTPKDAKKEQKDEKAPQKTEQKKPKSQKPAPKKEGPKKSTQNKQ